MPMLTEAHRIPASYHSKNLRRLGPPPLPPGVCATVVVREIHARDNLAHRERCLAVLLDALGDRDALRGLERKLAAAFRRSAARELRSCLHPLANFT